MPDFSVIMASPEVRALVQENLLQRAFHDALYPKLMFRSSVTPVLWPANVGDNMVFTGVGLIKPKMRPLTPGLDPVPSSYQSEQWDATLQQYADSIDTHMPASMVAIANLFLRNTQQLGLSAGQTINRLVRDRIFAAGMCGWTVATAGVGPTDHLPVARLNGFTKARYQGTNGSPVKFSPVSASNKLAITVHTSNAGDVAVNVIGFTPTNSGDETGPGTLILDGNVTVASRAYVISSDRTYMVNVGGAMSIDGIGSNDTLKLDSIRSAVANFWQENVPEMPDGRFHMHLDPTSLSQLYGDSEMQRLNTALPDYYIYKDFAVGEILGCVLYRNSEEPVPETVSGGLTASYDPDDPFAGELYAGGTTSGVPIHRPVLLGQGGAYEYYQDMSGLITEAGVTGKVGASRISNNGIDVDVERVQLIIRAPLNRLQDMVAASWKFIGDWPFRTDVTTGGIARYKRVCVINHGA